MGDRGPTVPTLGKQAGLQAPGVGTLATCSMADAQE